MTTSPTEKNGSPLPAWALELKSMYASGVSVVFGLHFNVNDYVVPGVRLPTYLDKLLARKEIIVHYNRAEGLVFPLAEHRERFMQVLGLDTPPDDALASLRAVQGGGGPQVQLPREPSAALRLLDQLLKSGEKCAVIIEHAETIVPNADKSMMGPDDRTALVLLSRWGTDPAITGEGKEGIAILVAANLAEVHPDMRAASSKVEWLEVPLPTTEQRYEYVTWLIEHNDPVSLEMPRETLAAMTAGLSRIHIEDIHLRAVLEGGQITYGLVRERKESIIEQEYGDILEIVDPRYGFEAVGGLDYVKMFFLRSVIEPMRDGNRRRCPQGILMTGPAGTGKTLLAEAVAKESGLNMVILPMDKILGGIVGTSEKNMAKALRCIESLAPCLVFMDEIDQGVSRGTGGSDGGSQVNKNLFSNLLRFMSDTDHRGRVIFVGASNRPDLMDAALKRPGRFDKKIPFLVPDENQRRQILNVMLTKYGLTNGDGDLDAVARNTDGYTGAELEGLVLKASETAEDAGHESIMKDDWLHALDAYTPSTRDIEYMTMLAIQEASDADLLPPGYRQQMRDRKALDAKLKELRPDEPERRGRREL